MNKKRLVIIAGIAVAILVIALVVDAALGNHCPAIISLIAEPTIVGHSGSSRLTCNASDRDGDELSYEWSASGGVIDWDGNIAIWTAPYSPLGEYTITVTVKDGHGGEARQTIIVKVMDNRPPIIHSLVAGAVWTLPSGDIDVTCNASDADNHQLGYEWSVSGGSITGTGPEIIWTAPEKIGVYNITVVVTDGYGGSDTRTLPLTVVTGQPPTIKDLIITASHCYLKTSSSPYKVGQEKEYSIECIVEQTDVELSYEWSCTGGEICGEGPLITWTAPNTSCTVTITVTVSDIAGNMAARNMVLSVVDCSWCTFHC